MQAEHGDTEYKNSPRIRIQGECNRTIRLWLYGVQNIRFTVRKSVDGAKWRIPLSEHVFFNSEKRHINCVNMYEMPRQLMAGPVCVCSYVLCICPAIVNWRRVPLSMSVSSAMCHLPNWRRRRRALAVCVVSALIVWSEDLVIFRARCCWTLADWQMR